MEKQKTIIEQALNPKEQIEWRTLNAKIAKYKRDNDPVKPRTRPYKERLHTRKLNNT
jgi:hypothetical protein